MKKFIASLTAVLSTASLFATPVYADDSANVYVTVTDGSGNLAVTMKNITVYDADSDGVLTVNDALYTIHESDYSGGAAAGYGYELSDYGISLTKLWGVENGGCYGYTVNNVFSMSLGDTISDGDYITAYSYTDTSAFSDKYTFFNVNAIEGNTKDTFTLTLSANSYDENWNSIVIPVSGATITFNGNATEYTTDSDGNVTITVDDVNTTVISAVSDSDLIIPPVCLASITEAPAETEKPADDTSKAPENDSNNNNNNDNNDNSTEESKNDSSDDEEIELEGDNNNSKLDPANSNNSSDKLATDSKNSDKKNSKNDKDSSDKKESDKTTDSKSADTGSKSPETGDKGIAGIVMLVSAAGLAAFLSKKKEK